MSFCFNSVNSSVPSNSNSVEGQVNNPPNDVVARTQQQANVIKESNKRKRSNSQLIVKKIKCEFDETLKQHPEIPPNNIVVNLIRDSTRLIQLGKILAPIPLEKTRIALCNWVARSKIDDALNLLGSLDHLDLEHRLSLFRLIMIFSDNNVPSGINALSQSDAEEMFQILNPLPRNCYLFYLNLEEIKMIVKSDILLESFKELKEPHIKALLSLIKRIPELNLVERVIDLSLEEALELDEILDDSNPMLLKLALLLAEVPKEKRMEDLKRMIHFYDQVDREAAELDLFYSATLNHPNRDKIFSSVDQIISYMSHSIDKPIPFYQLFLSLQAAGDYEQFIRDLELLSDISEIDLQILHAFALIPPHLRRSAVELIDTHWNPDTQDILPYLILFRSYDNNLPILIDLAEQQLLYHRNDANLESFPYTGELLCFLQSAVKASVPIPNVINPPPSHSFRDILSTIVNQIITNGNAAQWDRYHDKSKHPTSLPLFNQLIQKDLETRTKDWDRVFDNPQPEFVIRMCYLFGEGTIKNDHWDFFGEIQWLTGSDLSENEVSEFIDSCSKIAPEDQELFLQSLRTKIKNRRSDGAKIFNTLCLAFERRDHRQANHFIQSDRDYSALEMDLLQADILKNPYNPIASFNPYRNLSNIAGVSQLFSQKLLQTLLPGAYPHKSLTPPEELDDDQQEPQTETT